MILISAERTTDSLIARPFAKIFNLNLSLVSRSKSENNLKTISPLHANNQSRVHAKIAIRIRSFVYAKLITHKIIGSLSLIHEETYDITLDSITDSPRY